jgi:signal peptidase I
MTGVNDDSHSSPDPDAGLLGSGDEFRPSVADEFFGETASANDPWASPVADHQQVGSDAAIAVAEGDAVDPAVSRPAPRGLDGDDPYDDSHDDYEDGLEDGLEDGAESHDGEEEEEALRSPLRSLIEWGVVIVGAFVLAFVINAYLVQAFYIPSESMVPELVKNDRVLVNKISNRFTDPSRGELVVFRHPDPAANAGGERDLIKRIIGEPGDTVELVNGQVFVNGAQLEESYLPEGTLTRPSGAGQSVWTLGSDEYLVFGDNRANSQDGRFFGPVPRGNIIGRAFVKFWPLSDIEWL